MSSHAVAKGVVTFELGEVHLFGDVGIAVAVEADLRVGQDSPERQRKGRRRKDVPMQATEHAK
jgi:hypothetical protein